MSELGKRLIGGLTDLRDRLRDGRGTSDLKQRTMVRCERCGEIREQGPNEGVCGPCYGAIVEEADFEEGQP